MQRLTILPQNTSQQTVQDKFLSCYKKLKPQSQLYAVTYTIAPDVLNTFPGTQVSAIKMIMKQYVKNTPFIDLMLVLEKTKRGTPHFHGLLTLTEAKSSKEIFEYWPSTQNDLKLIRDVDNLERWSAYCNKTFKTQKQIDTITQAREALKVKNAYERQQKLPKVIWDLNQDEFEQMRKTI